MILVVELKNVLYNNSNTFFFYFTVDFDGNNFKKCVGTLNIF